MASVQYLFVFFPYKILFAFIVIYVLKEILNIAT